jgi:ComF family protein
MQYRNGLQDCQLEMLSQVYEPLIGLLLPELCRRCGAPAHTGFCIACREDFPKNEAACGVCGHGPLAPDQAECPSHPPWWRIARVVAPLAYAPPLAHYLHTLKYEGDRALGRCLGQMLAEVLGTDCRHVDAIVTVPLHRERLRERGFNQALEIGRAVSASLRRPILRAGIARTRATAPQTSLSCVQRRANLAAAFTVTRALSGLRIAVLDDVITTGATVNALAAELLHAGASHVEAWAVARTRAPHRRAS